MDCSANANHVLLLVKTIIQSYCKICLHHIAKQRTQEINEANVRKKLTKLILIKHQ